MRKPNPLSAGEKWIMVLTLVFALTMTGVYIQATRPDGNDTYSIHADGFAEETVPMESVDFRVNINTATRAELTRLPGVGEKLAERMIEYRKEHGRFRAVEELLEVNGIGGSKFAAMKDLIILEEEAER